MLKNIEDMYFNPVIECGREETGRSGFSIFMVKDAQTFLNAELRSIASSASLHGIIWYSERSYQHRTNEIEIEKI